MIGFLIALVVIFLCGLLLTFLIAACGVSGRISDMERQADDAHAAQQRADNLLLSSRNRGPNVD